MIKKSFTVALLLALSVMIVEAFEPPSKPEGYVTDLAKVFSPNAKTILTYKLDNLAKKTKYKPQVVVLTVPTIDDTPLFNAATDTFKKWKLGVKGKDNGILILVAVKEKQTRIEVGYGIEQYLSTIHMSEFFSLVKPDLDKGDYDKAINELVAHIATVLIDVKDETKINENKFNNLIIVGFIMVFLILIWICFKPRKVTYTSSYDQSIGRNRGYTPNRPSYPTSAPYSNSPKSSSNSSSDSGIGDIAAVAIGYAIGSMTNSNTSSESQSSEPSFSGGSGGETSGGGYSSSDSSSSSDSGGGGD